MSWLGDVFAFESFNLKDMLKQIRKNPDQLLLGAADPFSAKLWSKATGKDYKPIVNQWGGASDGAYERAEAAGIDTGAGRQAHAAAQTIASIYAGGAAMGAMGGAGGSAGGAGANGGNFLGNMFGRGATATNSVGPLSAGYAYTPTAANAVGPLASGYGYGAAGYYGATPALSAAGAPVVAANGASLFGTGSGASSGMTLQQLMDLAQQMPQGGGQQEQPPPMPAPMAPGGSTTQGGLLGPVYDGERDLVTKRRKRRGT